MSNSNTKFAPTERANAESVMRDAKALKITGLAEHIINIVPSAVVILNKQRQVVFKNQRLMELLSISSDYDILGKRLGELFNCIHANQNTAGCGTTEFCCECGAVRAIYKSQQHKVCVEKECSITSKSGDIYEYRVWASPYVYDGTDYTIFSFLDISDEKRREVLQHVFLHDMNNNLQTIIGYSDIASRTENKKKLDKSIERIQLSAKEIMANITFQKKLLQAEKGDLAVELTRNVSSAALVDEIVKTFSYADKPNAYITKGEGCDDFVFTTDRSLLLRVLHNMVKNAIEASSSSEVVSIRCTQENSSGIFSVHNHSFMPQSTQLQIFKRSFSTKGKGRGLGTYSMKLFGEKYLKGKVWFSTSKYKGTTFFISVPLSYEDV